VKISLLSGGIDKTYAFGLMSGMVKDGVRFDLIGSDEMEGAGILEDPSIDFYNLRGDMDPDVPVARKIFRILLYYFRLLKYSCRAETRIFHILWHNRFIVVDRTLMILLYKLLGKKVIFTAHNVNDWDRDGRDTFLNRKSLGYLYHKVDHIIVHTDPMRESLARDFGISPEKVSVIPIGINEQYPVTELSREGARKELGLPPGGKVLLNFGYLAPYKGLDLMVDALEKLEAKNPGYRLIIAGQVKKGYDHYWEKVKQQIGNKGLTDRIIEKAEFIPDEAVEVYFKAADALVLPYRQIFQSGVLLASYGFGLPVIATDVGSLRENIIQGETGYVCKPDDPESLAEAIEKFFQGDLYKDPERTVGNIIRYSREKYSWEKIGEKTRDIYQRIL